MVKDCILCKGHNIKPTSEENDNITYHLLPTDEDTRDKWISIILKKYPGLKKLSTDTYICSQHFSAKDFLIHQSGLRYLRAKAVPNFQDVIASEISENIHENEEESDIPSSTTETADEMETLLTSSSTDTADEIDFEVDTPRSRPAQVPLPPSTGYKVLHTLNFSHWGGGVQHVVLLDHSDDEEENERLNFDEKYKKYKGYSKDHMANLLDKKENCINTMKTKLNTERQKNKRLHTKLDVLQEVVTQIKNNIDPHTVIFNVNEDGQIETI